MSQATSFDICNPISIGRSLSVCRLIDAQKPSSGHGDLIVVVGWIYRYMIGDDNDDDSENDYVDDDDRD